MDTNRKITAKEIENFKPPTLPYKLNVDGQLYLFILKQEQRFGNTVSIRVKKIQREQSDITPKYPFRRQEYNPWRYSAHYMLEMRYPPDAVQKERNLLPTILSPKLQETG